MVTTNARTHGTLFVAVFGDHSVHAKCEQVTKTRTHSETFMELGQSRVPTQR